MTESAILAAEGGHSTPFVILGSTASGKSALAMALAARLESLGARTPEILSVDSMQVYRGMDIGTAKPTREERDRFPHHLIDIAEPSETFAVARFVEMADEAIASAAQRGVPLIVTGGTPLYYQSLFVGLFEGPPANDAIRDRLSRETTESLAERLRAVDPATRIHANDRKRLVRALEVFELTGQPISSLQIEWADASRPPRHRATWFGLNWDKEALNGRINARVKAMIAAGWTDEVRGLLARYGELSQTAAGATGYRELIAHVRGEMPLADAIEQIKIGTRQLARAQMKWFRRFRDVRWLGGNAPIEQNVDAVMRPSA